MLTILEGEPRNVVSPDLYAETFSAAVNYLTLQDFIDPERIGALGICGSGSFVISAARIDSRIKAVATSSMYDMGAVNRNGLWKAQSVEQRKAAIVSATQQRSIEAAGGEVQYTCTSSRQTRPISNASSTTFTFVSGDQAHSREFSEDAYAGAAEPKELYCDLYDRVDLIPFAKFAEFAVNNTATQ
ncbi:hypothetical protein PF005_g11525 [Phytophthora fragariae]|uniref:Dienelactone hydrolase domain-containing protein n=1 Tax=Phytophthora fragariae TaxID=53985 RepID=A0A6A3Z704_9STRA|nr:hypothetical protein PF010_g11316 [Phytophthora fragariae]KAE9210220.1 hypothetical protein PF005_g11525 [Phytophthora fragariae]KAE9230300.1 hypothetical protein PF002_g13059 [Phytophthora fragariae]KAE9308853.1 hypothetical protein PF001_g10964 [Phytophthora fragariae]